VCIKFFALTVEFKNEGESAVVLDGPLDGEQIEIVLD
jgi:hypothetical protein